MSTTELFPTFLQEPNEMSKWKEWVFELIQPYIKGRVLEINSEPEGISSVLLDHDFPLHLSHSDKTNRNFLRGKYKDNTIVKYVHNVDLSHPDFELSYPKLIGIFNTVIALNVTGYGWNEKMALQNAKALLTPNGCLITAVPSFTASYGELKLNPEEWKRYNRKPLKQLLNGYKILKARYYNLDNNKKSKSPEQFGFSAVVMAGKI